MSRVWLTGGKLPTPVTKGKWSVSGFARSGRDRIGHAGENHRLVLYLVAGPGEAWGGDGHNEVDIGVVVVLQDGGDVDHFALRIGAANFQIFPFVEATGFQALDQTLYTLVGANVTGEVNDRGFDGSAGCASFGTRPGGSRGGRLAMAQISEQQYRGK